MPLARNRDCGKSSIPEIVTSKVPLYHTAKSARSHNAAAVAAGPNEELVAVLDKLRARDCAVLAAPPQHIVVQLLDKNLVGNNLIHRLQKVLHLLVVQFVVLLDV